MTVAGEVRPPSDKSITHRALLMAALASGDSHIHGALTAADTRASAAVLRRLGVRVTPLRSGATVRVSGGPWRQPAAVLHCGNSGTTARLLLGLLAAHRFPVRLTGDASLRARPMRRVTAPLARMGATVYEERGDHLPLWICGGPLRRIRHASPVASAQVKSALLLAGLMSGVGVSVREPARSRDHTERLLRFLGARIRVGELTASVPPQRFRVRPFDLHVPGDASSAAFLVALAILSDRGELTIRDVGVNPTRTGYLRVLERMGAIVRVSGERARAGEPLADLTVLPSNLRSTVIKASEVPGLIDEIPILAVLAARARGETRFKSVGELRVKESDRLALVAGNLRAVGYQAEVQGDDLVVAGSEHPPRGRVTTGGDHRLAMAFGVLGTVGGARISLSEQRSVAVSFPGFFTQMKRLVGGR